MRWVYRGLFIIMLNLWNNVSLFAGSHHVDFCCYQQHLTSWSRDRKYNLKWPCPLLSLRPWRSGRLAPRWSGRWSKEARRCARGSRCVICCCCCCVRQHRSRWYFVVVPLKVEQTTCGDVCHIYCCWVVCYGNRTTQRGAGVIHFSWTKPSAVEAVLNGGPVAGDGGQGRTDRQNQRAAWQQ